MNNMLGCTLVPHHVQHMQDIKKFNVVCAVQESTKTMTMAMKAVVSTAQKVAYISSKPTAETTA